MLLKRSAGKTLKSNASVRLTAFMPLPVPLPVASASTPLIKVLVKLPPSPRTMIWRPSPASREIATSGMRWIASERLMSGNLAISSAPIESDTVANSRFGVQRPFQATLEALNHQGFRHGFLRLRGFQNVMVPAKARTATPNMNGTPRTRTTISPSRTTTQLLGLVAPKYPQSRQITGVDYGTDITPGFTPGIASNSTLGAWPPWRQRRDRDDQLQRSIGFTRCIWKPLASDVMRSCARA